MKQGQSSTVRLPRLPQWAPGCLTEPAYPLANVPVGLRVDRYRLVSWVGRFLRGILSIIWFVVSLPFRLVVGIIGLLSRFVGISLGFALMVVGMALWAGPLFILGIPLFLVGLFLTLRCLS